MEHKIIIPESVHAYTYLGEPVPFVPLKQPKKSGICSSCNEAISSTNKGDTATCPKCKVKVDISAFAMITTTETTTKHFREYGLFPSASRLASFGETPIELTNWYETRFAKFCWEHYRPNYGVYMRDLNRDLPAMKSEYADRGTKIHADIQVALEGEYPPSPDSASVRAISEIYEWERRLGLKKVVREKGHCDPEVGIGGTIDVDGLVDVMRIIGDYKSKHSASSFDLIKRGNRRVLWRAIKQLSGYAKISGGADKAFVIPVRVDDDHEDNGEVLFIPLTSDEMAKGLRAITAAQEAWCADLDYWPQEMYKDGKCMSLDQIFEGCHENHTEKTEAA